MSGLNMYLRKAKEKKLVQAYLDSELVEKANKYKDKIDLSWAHLLTALLERLVDEENL